MYQQFQDANSINQNPYFDNPQSTYDQNANSSSKKQNAKHEFLNKDINLFSDKNIQDKNFTQDNYLNDIDQNTYSMMTQRKGKTQKIAQGDIEECIYQDKEQEYGNVGIIFENKSSLVDLNYNYTLKKFVVTKQNKKQQEIFEKEYRILQSLKDHNITLDVISGTKETQQFQQIAGKTDLQLLKQKIKRSYIFDVFYFILLEKLNKMHELGIAHSDIKPKNIVLSYENEPFFIDFGGSVDLSDQNDYENYLDQFTPQFNLRTYFEIFIPKKRNYRPKTFQRKEEIKQCDRIQLSLTFLYLFCESPSQIKLFESKNYNQLIQILIENCENRIKFKYQRQFDLKNFFMTLKNTVDLFQGQNSNDKGENIQDEEQKIDVEDFCFRNYYMKQNRMIVVSEIIRNLNLADPIISVRVEGSIYQQKFFIDEQYLLKQLVKSNDIVYQEETYVVQSINKLNKFKYKLKIDPEKICITPLPHMKEYLFISQKYKINEYFQNLINMSQQFNNYGLLNTLQYLIAYKIQNHTIFFQDKSNFNQFFQIISNQIKPKSHFQLFLEIPNFHLEEFIDILNYYQTKLYAQRFEIFESKTICQVMKDSNQNSKQQVQVILHRSKTKYSDIKYTEIIQNYYEIKQLEFQSNCLYNYTDDFLNEEKEIKNCISSQIKQMNKQYNYPQKIFFERLVSSKTNSTSTEMSEKQIFSNFNCEDHKVSTKTDLKNLAEANRGFSQQQSNFCSKCLQNIFKIHQYLCLQIEKFTSDILLMKYTTQKIKIIIFDYNFKQRDMWLEIKDNVLTQNNKCSIKLILVNCQLSQQVVDVLREIKANYDDKVILKTKSNIELQKQEYSFLKYQLFIDYMQEQKKQEFKITLIEKIIFKESEINEHAIVGQQPIKIDQNNLEIEQFQNQDMNYLEFQNQQKYYNNPSNIDVIYQDKQFQIDLKQLQIQYNQQQIQFYHFYKNQFNQISIDYLIQNIINQQQYSDIHLFDEKDNSMYLFLFHNNKLEISCECNDIEMLSQLYLTIYRNYYKNNCQKYYSLNDANIKLQVDYQQTNIIQQICYKRLDEKLDQDQLQFLGIDINQNFNQNNDKERDSILLISYCINIKDKLEVGNIMTKSEINKRRITDVFIDDFNHFEKYSFTNQELKTIIFRSQLQHLQFDFKFQSFYFQQDYFKFLFCEIEKMFPQNKTYNLQNCSECILFDIYEVIKANKLQNKLYFDLIGNDILYEEFKQLINKIQQDLNYQFKFKIKFTPEMQNIFIKDFNNIFELIHIDGFILAQLKEPNNLQKQFKTKQICLEFIESDAQKYLKRMQNSQPVEDTQNDNTKTKKEYYFGMKKTQTEIFEKYSNQQIKQQKKEETHENNEQKNQQENKPNYSINQLINNFNATILNFSNIKDLFNQK